MQLDIKEKNDEKYIKLIGNSDGICSNDVTEQILNEIDQNENIVIDMSDCPYVSSAGLRTLLTIGKSIKMKNGHMNIVNLVEDVKEIMEMTGFGKIFKGFEN